jgi:hypothetical protein
LKRFGFREYIESGKGVAEILVGRGLRFVESVKNGFVPARALPSWQKSKSCAERNVHSSTCAKKETTSDGPVENAKGQMG